MKSSLILLGLFLESLPCFPSALPRQSPEAAPPTPHPAGPPHQSHARPRSAQHAGSPACESSPPRPPTPPNPSCSPPETAACLPRSSSRASSTSGAASSVRPSTTITIASASSSATRACRKISAGISASSSGTTPPVSTTRTIAPGPLHLAIDAVARNPRLIADNRSPRPRNPIEQRRLAHIRSPADRHQRQRCFIVARRLRQRQSNSGLKFLCLNFPIAFFMRTARSSAQKMPASCSARKSCFSFANPWSVAIVRRCSNSGLRVGVLAAFAAAAFFAANSLRFFGATAPVVAVARGADRPIFGRVLACRCFLPSRFFPPFGAILEYLVSSMVARAAARRTKGDIIN